MSDLMSIKDGVYALETIEEQMKYASFLISKKLISDTFKEPSQVMIAIQLCKDLSLPISCLKDFYVIGGKPAIFGDTFVALALGSGVIEEHVINFYDEDGECSDIPEKGKKVFSCVITGRRKGCTKNSSISYSMDDKEMSGNNNPNFKKHPRDMLFRRAMGRFVKWICADAIRGIEMADYAEEAVNRNPIEQILDAAKEDEARIRQEQTPPEELSMGPLYRIQNGKWRGKQFYEIDEEELLDYLDVLSKRINPKRWEIDLMKILSGFVMNYSSFKDMVIELRELKSEER